MNKQSDKWLCLFFMFLFVLMLHDNIFKLRILITEYEDKVSMSKSLKGNISYKYACCVKFSNNES